MCGIYCVAFIEYSIAAKNLLEYTNLFSSNDYQKNSKIIYMCLKLNMVITLSCTLGEVYETILMISRGDLGHL